MTERERLAEELYQRGFDNSQEIADLIIEDRKRICAPLINIGDISRSSPIWNSGGVRVEKLCQGIEETLELASLHDQKGE